MIINEPRMIKCTQVITIIDTTIIEVKPNYPSIQMKLGNSARSQNKSTYTMYQC